MMMRLVLTTWLAMSLGACDIIGPSCMDRRETGPVTSLSGEVAAGTIVSHTVSYGTQGSQNNADIRWTGSSGATGPRISVYVTRTSCENFDPSQNSGSGDCSTLARAGVVDGIAVDSFILTHGRGNPEVLGSPAQYKMWIVGDPEQRATYTVAITYFYGPDC